MASVDPPGRPKFLLPFPHDTTIELQTYVGHNPDDKKIDMYRQAMKIGSPILAAAAGVVHEWFDPGGLEIRHGGGWFTVYLHISERIASGTKVERGDWIGTMGSVGTH
jgi:murein DD-endopeptidase MepM/ murein hydrolase activator NlpD